MHLVTKLAFWTGTKSYFASETLYIINTTQAMVKAKILSPYFIDKGTQDRKRKRLKARSRKEQINK